MGNTAREEILIGYQKKIPDDKGSWEVEQIGMRCVFTGVLQIDSI